MRTKFLIILFNCILSINLLYCQDKLKKDPDYYVYLEVDELPKFEYNGEGLYSYIYSKLTWPVEVNVQGMAIITSMIVTKEGRVRNVNIEKEIGFIDNKDIKDIFYNMPNWIPGKYNGKSVDVLLLIPIIFRIY